MQDDVLCYRSAFLKYQLVIFEHWSFSKQGPTNFFEARRGKTCALTVISLELVTESQLFKQPGDSDRARCLEKVESYIWHFDTSTESSRSRPLGRLYGRVSHDVMFYDHAILPLTRSSDDKK